jgi:hypothetical protein
MMKIAVEEDAPVYALLYLRVSTDRQAEEGYSIDIQKERLTAYVKSMFGSQNVKTELFIDATCIIGTNQNPARGWRFVPVFFVFRNFGGGKVS